MRSIKLIFFFCLVVTLSACVQKLWQISYSSFENDYTHGKTLVLTHDSIYLAGFTFSSESSDNKGAFVSRFDSNGTMQWETLVTEGASNMSTVASGNVLAVDGGGYSYLVWGGLNVGVLRLYKLDPQGQVVDDWPILDGPSGPVFADDVQIDSHNRIVISANKGRELIAFSTDGELLWKHSFGGGFPTNPQERVTLIPLVDGRILHANQKELRIIEGDGASFRAVTTGEVGVEQFQGADVLGDKVGVAASSLVDARLMWFDFELQMRSEVVVGGNSDEMRISSAGDHLCLVRASQIAEGAPITLSVTQFDMSGITAQTDLSIAAQPFWELGGLKANDKGCLLAESFGEFEVGVSSRIAQIDSSGAMKEEFVVDDHYFLAFDALGNEVVRSGLTGDYDGSFTAMSLIKVRR